MKLLILLLMMCVCIRAETELVIGTKQTLCGWVFDIPFTITMKDGARIESTRFHHPVIIKSAERGELVNCIINVGNHPFPWDRMAAILFCNFVNNKESARELALQGKCPSREDSKRILFEANEKWRNKQLADALEFNSPNLNICKLNWDNRIRRRTYWNLSNSGNILKVSEPPRDGKERLIQLWVYSDSDTRFKFPIRTEAKMIWGDILRIKAKTWTVFNITSRRKAGNNENDIWLRYDDDLSITSLPLEP
jgi:hypothetical protein